MSLGHSKDSDYTKQEMEHNTELLEARETGLKQGIKEGIEQGSLNSKLEIAKKLLKKEWTSLVFVK